MKEINKVKPYTYLVKHKATGKAYYGSRCQNFTKFNRNDILQVAKILIKLSKKKVKMRLITKFAKHLILLRKWLIGRLEY